MDVSKCESRMESKETNGKSTKITSIPAKQNIASELENSMMFRKENKSWRNLSNAEDSFLTMEWQCQMEDKQDRLINSNDTLLFDVEPPSELWNQTDNPTEDLDKTEDEYEDSTTEISPVKYIGLIRPSTIIEETSSQFDLSSKNVSSLAMKSSLFETASINESVKKEPANSCHNGNESKSNEKEHNSPSSVTERQRRGTFAFKRTNYTFFPNENPDSINECKQFSENLKEKTPNKYVHNSETNSTSENSKNEDQFNNTLERVDYLLEMGKQIQEETPVTKRHDLSLLDPPLLSCKRKRLLNEMASIEMLPQPKRGLLLDFSTPGALNKLQLSKFMGK